MFKSELVKIDNQRTFTTSLVIAEKCPIEKKGVEKNRDHRDVMELIKKYQNIFERDEPLRFKTAMVNRKQGGGVSTEYVELTETQATFLVTLFQNSNLVVEFKFKLSSDFVKAKKEIARLQKIIHDNHQDGEWVQLRADGKGNRKSETAIIKEFVAYAHAQGSKSPDKYYQALSKMMNEQLFIVDGKTKNLRELMGKEALRQAQRGDWSIESSLLRGMDKQLPYKEVFKEAKQDIIRIAERYGKVYVPLTKAIPADNVLQLIIGEQK